MNMLRNNDAVSISVGFILTFAVTVLIFSTIMISFYSLSSSYEEQAMRESFRMLGCGLAAKITTVDTIINITHSMGGKVNTFEYEFTLPITIADNSYSIEISNKEITIESDNIEAWIPINTSINIEEKTIYSNAEDYKIIYKENNITIEKQ